MSKKVSPIPRGYRTATPCLTVYDVDSAGLWFHTDGVGLRSASGIRDNVILDGGYRGGSIINIPTFMRSNFRVSTFVLASIALTGSLAGSRGLAWRSLISAQL